MSMGPKKVRRKVGAPKKMLPMELKLEIIEKREQGMRVADLARHFRRSTSTICTILKQKEIIKAITPAKGVMIISRLRTSLHEEMEKLLMVWVTEKQLRGDTLTRGIICAKAREIFNNLVNQTPRNSRYGATEGFFKASRGWFDNFRKRTGIDSVVMQGEAASLDGRAAFEGFEPEVLVEKEIVFLGKSMGPVKDERDVSEEDSRNEEFEEQHFQVLQETAFEEKPEAEEVISTNEIKEILEMWEIVSQFVAKRHPEKVATGRASELFNDTCLTYFRDILKKRTKQTSLDSFFFNPEENIKTLIKEEKNCDKN